MQNFLFDVTIHFNELISQINFSNFRNLIHKFFILKSKFKNNLILNNQLRILSPEIVLKRDR